MVTRLRYGNTNTFLVRGTTGNLLVDTDYAGTLPAFYREIKKHNITVSEIDYVVATHYHPDHMGIVGELVKQGVKLLLVDTQKPFVHFSDGIFEREKRLNYIPIDEENATIISVAESREFLENLGISGEIITTTSHSEDSISLFLTAGNVLWGTWSLLNILKAMRKMSGLKPTGRMF
ncbi:MAG: MBL fold metallo-hydrolase [Oscillospiraceae bacterium]|nr:MBL fold metallo-hydrolase [Oscillospiraceae bacterium]